MSERAGGAWTKSEEKGTFMASPTPAPAGRKKPAREHRITRQRKALDAALNDFKNFLSAQQLHQVMADRGASVSLATTYRVLQTMAEEGLVDSMRTPEGETVYRRCSVTTHHHHLLCRHCRTVKEIEAPEVEGWAAKVGDENNFTDTTHFVEVTGLCHRCSRTRGSTVRP